MSYCRFQNTVRDFQDCVNAMNEGLELSSEEQRSFIRMVKLCREVAENYEGMDDDKLRKVSSDDDEDDEDDDDEDDFNHEGMSEFDGDDEEGFSYQNDGDSE